MAVDDTRSDSSGAVSPSTPTSSTGDDLEAELGAERVEQRDVALALVAEVEVLAHHDDLGVEAPDELVAHEVRGRLLRPDLVEVDHQRVVDAGGGQQLELLVEVGEHAAAPTRAARRWRGGGRR